MQYSLRATRAFAVYHDAKWGAPKDEAETVLDLCDYAWRYYPHNYRFAEWAARRAYDHGSALSEADGEWYLESAEAWADKGLAENPWSSELRYIKAQLLRLGSPAAAAEFWAAFVDWNFWEPFNHAVLISLYAEAGDLDRAQAEYRWVKGTPYEAEARRAIDEARARAGDAGEGVGRD